MTICNTARRTFWRAWPPSSKAARSPMAATPPRATFRACCTKAAKDADHGADKAKIICEVADLWFHCMVALAHYGLTPDQVLAELQRRAGSSGIEEKALRKLLGRGSAAQARESP